MSRSKLAAQAANGIAWSPAWAFPSCLPHDQSQVVRRSHQAFGPKGNADSSDTVREKPVQSSKELEQSIVDLPASLERVAALTLLAAVVEARFDCSFDRGDCREGEVGLTGLRPFLARAVAATVADALDNPKRVMAHSPLWTGYRADTWVA